MVRPYAQARAYPTSDPRKHLILLRVTKRDEAPNRNKLSRATLMIYRRIVGREFVRCANGMLFFKGCDLQIAKLFENCDAVPGRAPAQSQHVCLVIGVVQRFLQAAIVHVGTI